MTDKKSFFEEELQDDLKEVEEVKAVSDILKYIERIQEHVQHFDQIIYVQNQRIEQLHNLVSLIVSRDAELTKIIEEYGKKQGIIDEKED